MTARTRIKVCGMTDPAEARAVVDAGVDALGFIFVKESPRAIAPERAREIIEQLPPFVDAVGVFMNEEADIVNEIVQYCELTLVQLHGVEPPQYCEEIDVRVIKTFSIPATGVVSETEPFYDPYQDVVAGFLLDTCHRNRTGGTGRTFDWQTIHQARPPGPLILAGGLTPDNVAAAIEQVRPFAVDVNSGVETEPGVKDIGKVERLIAEVGRADQRLNS